MIKSDNDIQPDDALIVIDLEWIGNSLRPHTTHISQLACKNIYTGSTFARHLSTLSHRPSNQNAMRPRDVYLEWLQWLDHQGGGTKYLIAHNGIRYDASVLRHNMATYGVVIPSTLKMLDSLYHIRFHSRCWKAKPERYNIDSLCALLNITVDTAQRHTATYDVELLCNILTTVSTLYGTPLISGAAHPVSKLSTMLVHGVGPVVNEALPYVDLALLCSEIVQVYGSMSLEHCLAYLQFIKLKQRVPLCNLETISNGIVRAAKQYLQYIE